MTQHAPPPPAPPWEDHMPDDDPDPSEQAARAFEEANQLHVEVSKRARRLKVDELARARLRAEKVSDTNFADQYLTRAQLLDLPKPEPLIDNVLPRHSYAILRGRDHSLKSFLAIDWALCLATGKDWQSHEIQPTRVLYVAGEGASGISGRVDAWEYAWDRPVPDDMFTVRQTALNLHQPGPAYDHLLEHVAAGGYGLVIIDTLRRVSGAADGNSSEMGLVIDHLDQIKQATDRGSVLTVAHTDKGDHDTRGYSGIEDDADVVWSARREDMLLTLTLAKMKDGPDGQTIHLVANQTLGSLTLSGTSQTMPEVTNETQLKVLDALREIYRDGATPAQLVDATGISKATVHRAINTLTDAGHLVNTGTKKRKYLEIPPLPADPPEASETQPKETLHE